MSLSGGTMTATQSSSESRRHNLVHSTYAHSPLQAFSICMEMNTGEKPLTRIAPQLYATKRFSDLIVVVSDESGSKEVQAHRAFVVPTIPLIDKLVSEKQESRVVLYFNDCQNSCIIFEDILEVIYMSSEAVQRKQEIPILEYFVVFHKLELLNEQSFMAMMMKMIQEDHDTIPYLVQQYQQTSLLMNAFALPQLPSFAPLFPQNTPFGLPITSPDVFQYPLNGIETSSSVSSDDDPCCSRTLDEITVPSDDTEGWCRNKKYIREVPNGFMCTICKKTYGRYNSVSYHVTIYHRNAPIKCDWEDCNFSTREARYIHFHKYYRHNVPLPESIDVGSRRCPYPECSHVSKSPAMLAKHIRNRHYMSAQKNVTDPSEQFLAANAHISQMLSGSTTTELFKNENENVSQFVCAVCQMSCSSPESLAEHVRCGHNLLQAQQS
ncbi:hypothetical protein QR680_001313 [Steinernema hermaphroditum]|uniref:BTB domain-containing protein n=1 Tax=Steinernema hermaphroditum TaxID=289476 RepID=A0AA39GYH6_9BILA|nr:hypothetical protein QR680_001313 [Steinernema hermaphroditum]